MRILNSVNQLLHDVFAARLRHAYVREMAWIKRMSPASFAVPDSEIERRHLQIWSRLDPRVSSDWLRLLVRVSGQINPNFVPSTIYYGIIERCLNNCDISRSGIEDKNLMALYVPKQFRANCILRYLRGVFFDDDFNPLTMEQADRVLREYPTDVVGKVACGSSGGHSVELYHCSCDGRKRSKNHDLTARWIAANTLSYVVQERLYQESVAASYNPYSINTCRIMTYRRPWDGVVRVGAAMFRTGSSEDIVDNISSGGASVGVRKNGQLQDWGLDSKFRIVDCQPLTGKAFKGGEIPGFKDMCEVVCSIARHVPDFNILGFDVIVRNTGTPCVVEVNSTSLCAIEVQMSGPMFGDDTESIVDWCETNRKFDKFRHLRTWY